MRRKLFLILVILFVILTGCDQFFRDIEKDFEYWSSTVIVTDTVIPSIGTDMNGYPCITSDGNKTISLKLVNPQNYTLKTPVGGNYSDIIKFGSGTVGSGLGTPPVYGTDFTLTQNGPNELNLTLKQVFLKKNEQGNADINPSITLSSSDGRKFGTHSFKLRVNTPPPVPVYKATGKIQSGGKWFYVLCFKVEGMPGADNLHKDIQKLYVNGLPGSPFTVTSTGGDFGIGSTNGNLVNIGSVHQLAPGDCLMPPEILPSGPWLLCVKTEVGVKTGAAKRYTLKLEDSKGLESLAVTQATPENPYTINSSAPNAWQTLRDAVQDTSGPAVIAIDGTITAPGGAECKKAGNNTGNKQGQRHIECRQ